MRVDDVGKPSPVSRSTLAVKPSRAASPCSADGMISRKDLMASTFPSSTLPPLPAGRNARQAVAHPGS